MNILLVHEHYQHPGGEDTVFSAEVELLESHGHHVERLEFHNAVIPERAGIMAELELAANTIWSRSAAQKIGMVARKHRPDIAHFHNTFPLISPAAYSACKLHGIPVVQTLHNYRPLCPNVLFFEGGHVCEKCLGKLIQYPGVLRGCYRGSRSQTATVAVMNAAHRLRGTWEKDVDQFIAMTQFERDKFIEGGFAPIKISVKPHFVGADQPPPEQPREGLLYVGRLSREKGILTLIKAWESVGNIPLMIVGDGPLADDVRALEQRHPDVHFLGQQPHDAVHVLMRQSCLLIAPTEMYETFGLVVIEAFAASTPVLGTKIGAIGELITPEVNGLHFKPGDAQDLAEKIQWAAAHSDEMRRMGKSARREYEDKYTPERNYGILMNIYGRVIAEAAERH